MDYLALISLTETIIGLNRFIIVYQQGVHFLMHIFLGDKWENEIRVKKKNFLAKTLLTVNI